MTFGILAVSIVFMLIGMAVQFRLKSKFAEYAKYQPEAG